MNWAPKYVLPFGHHEWHCAIQRHGAVKLIFEDVRVVQAIRIRIPGLVIFLKSHREVLEGGFLGRQLTWLTSVQRSQRALECRRRVWLPGKKYLLQHLWGRMVLSQRGT